MGTGSPRRHSGGRLKMSPSIVSGRRSSGSSASYATLCRGGCQTEGGKRRAAQEEGRVREIFALSPASAVL